MKKREIKKRISDGFLELAPDIFDAVLEAVKEQELLLNKTNAENIPMQMSEENGRLQAEPKGFKPDRQPFGFGKVISKRLPQYVFSVCASLALIFLCFFVGRGDGQKNIYMTLDINPSIQVTMNESFQVKQLKGLNADGKDVVSGLSWKKSEPVQELLDVLVQDVVEKSYLCEDGGILVTFSALDEAVCNELEGTFGQVVGRKLNELEVSGVTIAFQKADKNINGEGRRQLETKLVKTCGLSKEQVRQMSVVELIRYCQENTSLELKTSEITDDGKAISLQQGQGQNVPSKQAGNGKNTEIPPVEEDIEQIQEESENSEIQMETEQPGEDETGSKNLKKKEPENQKTDGSAEGSSQVDGGKTDDDPKNQPPKGSVNEQSAGNGQSSVPIESLIQPENSVQENMPAQNPGPSLENPTPDDYEDPKGDIEDGG